jgi:hypothetical protein
MVEFNFVILSSFMISGYKFVGYRSLEHFAILTPCMEEGEAGENVYVIPINDEQAYEMAGGLTEFSFYVLL